MADYVIIAGKTVIDANTDFTGRNVVLSGNLTVGNTSVNSTAISTTTLSTKQFTSNTATIAASILVGNSTVNLVLTPTGLSTLGSLTVSNTTINGTLNVTGVSTVQTITAAAINGASMAITNASDAILYLTTTAAPTTTYRQKAIFSSVNVGGGTDWLFRSTRPSDGATRDVQFTSTGAVWMTGNFDPNTKFDKTGGPITGSLTVSGSVLAGNTVSSGYVTLQPSNGLTNSGYMEFWNANTATREGYIGFADKSGVINLGSDRAGGYFNFVGNIPRIAGQPIWYPGNFNPATKADLTGAVFTGDLTTHRNDKSGVIFLGRQDLNGGRYLFYDGNTYILTGAGLSVGGALSTGGGITTNGSLIVGAGQNASYVTMTDTDEGTRTLHNNSGTIGFLGADGGWKFRVYDSGAIWTAQLGDLNQRIEDRANAYASGRVAKTGDVMSGNLSIQPGSYPSINLLYPSVKWWGMQIRENGWLYFPEDNLANFNIAFTPGGNIWSNAFGGTITDRIETRAQAWANTRQANLGFTPVRQGGGNAQQNNTVYLGWDGYKLRAQVDGFDLGGLFAQGQINPIQDMRLQLNENAPASRFAGGDPIETIGGAVITGLGLNGAGGINSVRTRQLQKLDSYGNWYGVAYSG